jgi:peptidoglycan/xylan/chitin deacetylase (PgdA/CDA1 family)
MAHAWSREPPGGLKPSGIPQLVSITFDDNFGLADPSSAGGMNYILDFYKDRRNPPGTGNAENFDGAPIKATFYYTSIYLIDSAMTVLRGKPGEDEMGRNRAAWTAAFQAGHEAADHTVNHLNGGVVPLNPGDCCRPRNWSAADWEAEIRACRDSLTSPSEGIGARASDVIGFRAPFLGYNDAVFTALQNLKLTYDSTLPNCFDDMEDGRNCSWPYTLDAGSPDAIALARKFSTGKAGIPVTFPNVMKHPGLWEIPPSTLVIPPDEMAGKYGFAAGLRARAAARVPLPYPGLYEAQSGKITGLDYTLLIDAGLTGGEMAAVLKYNLDLHMAGNRSPLVFVAHSHLYAFSSQDDNPDTPSAAVRDARWKGLTDFITYALSKPEARIVAVKDILAWVQRRSGFPN